MVEPQTGGPPKLVLNPAVMAPAGGTTYSGSGFFNSGFLQGTQSPAPGPRSYALTFDKAGTYKYVCVLHDGMGMVGTITVVAAGTPTTLPVTGGSSPFGLPLSSGMLALAALAGVLVAAGLLLRRQRVGA